MAYGIHAKPITWVVHVLGVFAIALILVWVLHFRGGLAFSSTNKSLIFNVHPVFMFIGFIFIASEAILAYKVVPGTKYYQKAVHLALHAVAFVLGIVGLYAVFKYHIESNIVNLYSLHSWLGILTMVLFAIQWLVGFISFWFPGAQNSVRARILPWHVFSGLFIYVLALATAEIGFLEKLTFLESGGLYKYGSEALLVNFTAVVVVVFGVLVVLSAILPVEEEAHEYRALD